jgi:hypothetical protein
METYSFTSYNSFLPFISLVFAMATFIILLTVLWRVQHHLAVFVKWCLAAVCVFIVRKVMFVLGFNNESWWSMVLQLFDAAMFLAVFFAVIQLYKLVRLLDGESQNGRSGMLKPNQPLKTK